MSDEWIIELSNLSKTFHVGFRRKRVDAVKNIDLKVKRGEIFGLIGPNGAGKTTTIKMLTGLIKPTSGSMKLMGFDGFDRKCSQKLGYLPEISYYYESLTACEILDFYAKLYGIHHDREKRVNDWLEKVGLIHAKNKRLGQFSKGMLQRVGLAQALIGDPDLVILDEPQSGLDPLGRRDVAELILDCKKKGKTVFFSSHILPDVERLCDRVGVIRNGQMESVGSLSELTAGHAHTEIQILGSLEQIKDLLNKINDLKNITAESAHDSLTLSLPPNAAHRVNEILAAAIQNQLTIAHVLQRGMDLESLFTRQNPSASQPDSDAKMVTPNDDSKKA